MRPTTGFLKTAIVYSLSLHLRTSQSLNFPAKRTAKMLCFVTKWSEGIGNATVEKGLAIPVNRPKTTASSRGRPFVTRLLVFRLQRRQKLIRG